MIFLATLLLGLAECQAQALQSPCSEVLTYDTKDPRTPSQWRAQLTFPPGTSDWQQLIIDLNKKSHLLGTSTGDVSSQDNMRFIIDNDKTGQGKPFKLFVKYDPDDPAPPTVQQIRLDGRTICSTEKPVQPTPVQQPPFIPLESPTPVQQPPYIPLERPIPVQLPPYIPSERPTPVQLPPYIPSERPIPVQQPPYIPSERPIPVQLPPYIPSERPTPVQQPPYIPSERPIPVQQPPYIPSERPTPVQQPPYIPSERIVPVPRATIRTTERPITVNRPLQVIPRIGDEEPQCGIVKLNNSVAPVVGGSPTLEGQWPWQVALYSVEGLTHKYKCGGTLVSRRHVVTAAHCTTVKNSRPTQKVDETSLIVYLGKHDLITSIDGVQIRLVAKITIFPEYDPSSLVRDLSVLLLRKPVEYTNWVQPACLWPDNMADIAHIVVKKGSVVGWGSDGTGKLMLTEMYVVSQETCLRAEPNFYIRVTSNYTFCAGQRNGQSTCNSDSGGGMVFSINNVWYLRGVVSLAKPKENVRNCDPRNYVVFTDVAKYLPWIRENIEPY